LEAATTILRSPAWTALLEAISELLSAVAVACALFWSAVTGPAPNRQPQSERSDEELMASFSKGDARAFRILMGRYQSKVYGFIAKSVFDKDKVDDLFQESFYKVVRAADTFDPNQRFSTWLFTVVRHTLIDFYKKRRLRTTHLSNPLGHDDDRTLGELLPDRSSPEGESLSRKAQLEKKLYDVLGRMNPDQREVFLLRHYEGLPFNEIADLQGIPENTAKTRMRYALELLKKELVEFI
jgi:RNA polymerase sigma-70 factor (ECF subfamily)